ncbi:hypothetical protein ACFLTX_00195 [Chloroflexota bacterium]
MKNTWKWIIGIVVALVVIALMVCGAIYLKNQMMAGECNFSSPRTFQSYPHMHKGGQGYMHDDHYGMMQGYGFRHPMLGYGYSFLHGLFPLALFGLIVYGAYRLGVQKGEQQPKRMEGQEPATTEEKNTKE